MFVGVHQTSILSAGFNLRFWKVSTPAPPMDYRSYLVWICQCTAAWAKSWLKQTKMASKQEYLENSMSDLGILKGSAVLWFHFSDANM